MSPPGWPWFGERARGEEYLDDPGLSGEELVRSLEDLRWINRWLGGYRSVRLALEPALETVSDRPLHLLDLGTGLADLPAHLVRWAERRGRRITYTAVDNNPHVLEAAGAYLDRTLSGSLRGRVEVVEADVRAVLGEEDQFDLVTAALFLHHFSSEEAADLLAAMDRASRLGFIVSDLHRSLASYGGVALGTRLLGASPVTVHDGPLSVRRGFLRADLDRLAEEANLDDVRVRWRWAFRWVLTTTLV